MQAKLKRAIQLGVTALEMMIALLILVAVTLIAVPTYQNYTTSTSAITVLDAYAAFSEEYVARSIKDGKDLCDAEYLAQLDLSSQPASTAVNTKVDISPIHGLVFTVTAKVDEGAEAIRVASQAFDSFSQELIVGTPSVTQSVVSFAARIGEPCTFTSPISNQAITTGPISCNVDQYFDGQQCMKAPSCQGGQVLSQDNKNCECPSNQVYDGKQCFSPPSCSNGQVLSSDSRSCACPAGQSLIGAACMTPPSCGGGQIPSLDYKSCECPHGQQFDGQNCFTPPPCQGGQIHTPDMKGCTCPAGQQFDGGQCFTPPICTGGQILSADNKFCHCPSGQLFDGAQCFSPPMCSGGQVHTSDHKACVCPSGQLFDGSNCFTPPDCIGNQILSGDSKSCSCPTGQNLIGGSCITPPTCVGGQRLSSDGLSCQCPSGTSFNAGRNQCESAAQQVAECQRSCRVQYPHGNSRAYRNCLAQCR